MFNENLSRINLEDAEFCVVDTETTGLSARNNYIIEIGMVRVSKLKITETYHTLINPGKAIPYFITSMTGISNDDVYNAPFFEDIADEILEFIGEKVLTAHNLSFDKSFLKYEFIRAERNFSTNHELCTVKLAKKLYPYLRSRSLSSVCAYLKLKNYGTHRALSDAEVTAKALIKMIKEAKEKNSIQTLGELIALQSGTNLPYKPLTAKKELGEDVSSLPHAPGIYYFLNSKNEIIYIGKAKSLRDRVKSYFSPAAPRKAKRIIKQAARLKIELTNSELTAFLTEAESIKLINPKHNSQLKKYGSKYFLRITAAQKFPALEICNYFDFDGNDYFGLFISRSKAQEVFEVLTKTFALRECDDKEFSKGQACFLAQIDRCIAPCETGNADEYKLELEKVYEFLYGKSQAALNRLLNKMKEYSEKQKYEKAAEVKKLVDMILSQTHKSSLLAEPVNSANVLFEINEGFGSDYILMITGKIFVKKYSLKNRDYFEEAVDDFYEGTINLNVMPEDEDLEKMKITLNWLIKHRNKVRIFYLKDYKSKSELYAQLANFNFSNNESEESTFDIKNFINSEVEI